MESLIKGTQTPQGQIENDRASWHMSVITLPVSLGTALLNVNISTPCKSQSRPHEQNQRLAASAVAMPRNVWMGTSLFTCVCNISYWKFALLVQVSFPAPHPAPHLLNQKVH